jgi:hypothetical protein
MVTLAPKMLSTLCGNKRHRQDEQRYNDMIDCKKAYLGTATLAVSTVLQFLQVAPLYLPEEHVGLWESTKAGTVAAAPSSHNRSIRQSKKNSQIKVKRFHTRIVSAHISTPYLMAIDSKPSKVRPTGARCFL